MNRIINFFKKIFNVQKEYEEYTPEEEQDIINKIIKKIKES